MTSASIGHKICLSERQVEAVRKNIAREAEWAVRRAAESAAVTATFPEGRQTVEGEMISTKVQDGSFGLQVKMLVKLDDGNKVWGTVPRVIEEQLGSANCRGRRIRFTASFDRSQDDEHFGFFKRPTGAELL